MPLRAVMRVALLVLAAGRLRSLATRDQALIDSPEFRRGKKIAGAEIARIPIWTDERSNLFRILRR